VRKEARTESWRTPVFEKLEEKVKTEMIRERKSVVMESIK
jgi:hypothetical protein